MSFFVNRKRNYLLDVASRINSIHDIDLLLESLLSEARRLTSADAGSIYIKTSEKYLSIKYSQNAEKERFLKPGEKLIYSLFKIPIDEKTLSGYVAMTAASLNVPDMYSIPDGKPYSHNVKYDEISNYRSVSSLTVPLLSASGEVLGVIQLINKKKITGKKVPFASSDEMVARVFSGIASLALERSDMTRSLLRRMIKMTSLRDPRETAAHATRVAAMAVEIYSFWALRNGVPQNIREKNKDLLKLGAVLHDVGKVGISDMILKKKGRLTDAEREIMKRHSFIGFQLFKDAHSKYELAAKEIALRHHENWDGTGYPGHIDLDSGYFLYGSEKGLAGTEIPFFARIVAICDVYDALSHKRVYKDAWDQGAVIAEIKKMSGTKFDPELVEIFLKVYANIRKICKLYPDTDLDDYSFISV